MSAARPFRTDIQALRALAVLLVVCAHVVGWPGGGFIGVDVFFVISGFLITSGLLEAADRPALTVVAEFYARRARRILPAALVVLALTVVAARLVFNAERADRVATDGVWAGLFAANWRFAEVGTDYFASDTPPSPLQHYWSLGVEEQFYLVWPVLLVAVLAATRRAGAARSVRTCLELAIAIAVLSFAWACWQSATDPTWAYFSTLTRVWEIAVGAVVACLVGTWSRLGSSAREGLAVAGFLGILGSAVLIDDQSPFPAPLGAVPVLATAAVLVAGTASPSALRVHRATTFAPVLRLGLISFSVYLWHWAVIVLAEPVLGGPEWFRDAAVLSATLVLAELTYRFVERPFLASRQARQTVRRLRWAAIASTAAVVVLAAVLGPGATRPAPGREPLPELSATAGATDPVTGMTATLQAQMSDALGATEFPLLSPPVDRPEDGVMPEMKDFAARCLNPPDPADESACTFAPDDPNGQDIVIIGDSIAAAWLPGIRAAMLPEGYTVHAVTFSSCPPALVDLGVGTAEQRDACDRGLSAALEQLESLRPALVVGSAHQDTFGGITVRPPAPDVHGTYVEGLREVGDRVRANDGRFVLLGPPPAGPSPLACGGPMQGPDDCVASSFGNFDATLFAFSSAAAEGGFGMIDTRQWFCVDTRCPIFAAGRLIRWDEAHMTHQFSSYLAPLLRARLTQELQQG